MKTADEIVREEATREVEAQAKALLMLRQQAYVAVFARDEKGNFSPMGKDVLEDLAEFCHAHTSTFNADARVQSFNEGKRDVWLRISRHLDLESQRLWDLYKRRDF